MVQKIRSNSIAILGMGLFLLVVVTAGVIAGQGPAYSPLATPNHQTIYEPRDLEASTSSALHVAFETEQYDLSFASKQAVPPLMLTSLPEDFASVQNPRKRQDLFLRAILPIVLIENRRISEQRELASLLLEGDLPAEGSPMRTWLKKLAMKLRVRGDLNDERVQTKLLGRLDVIPVQLALAQAAIETGWGTSRFALEGNSLFGQWTFKSKAGLIPTDRDNDATHFVATYPDLRASVRSYMRNLNTGRAYTEFRQVRASMRTEGKPLDALELASHLNRYSERGDQYTAELQQLIRNHRISTLSKASLGSLKSKLLIASLD